MNYDPNTGEPLNKNYNKTNGFAIAGLVLAILQIGILSMIFSIIGLVKADEYGNGKGFAIAGIIISVIHFIFVFLITALVVDLGAQFINWASTEVEKYHNNMCLNSYDCECDDYSKKCRCIYYDSKGDYKRFITCDLDELP